MQKILGLRTTIYYAENIEKANKWYASAFGCEPYFVEPYYVGFNISGYELGLQPQEKQSVEKIESVISYWGVEDVASMYQHFIDLGATAHEAPTNVGGDIVVASVKDPWNNIIGLIYNPDFKPEAI